MKRCSTCKEDKSLEKFNKDKTYKDGLSKKCKQCISIYDKQNYIKNKDRILSHVNFYQNNNKDKIKIYQIKYKTKENENFKLRYKNDIQFRLKRIYRNRIYYAFKNQGLKKPKDSIELLGISFEDYKLYLESLFLPEMDWKNRGIVWEIDHIKICCSFDLTDPKQVKECFHYSNTRPIFKTTQIAESFGYIDQIENRNRSKK